ncbi:MAG TPA: hypothetical protein VEW74_06820 [Candidatus Nitrosotalea sp.]|nr:hypothetical protein [Candidatus Nitrosotalea sp.]
MIVLPASGDPAAATTANKTNGVAPTIESHVFVVVKTGISQPRMETHAL